ncbi:replication factor-a protein [Gautieria morchelliformis]|nr:replication factor-a protein [Gautieria morchelliformis]
MDVDYHLTAGACAQITQLETTAETCSMQPTVQFLSIKKLPPAPGTPNLDRYRLIISDGVHFVQAMLATQLNELVEKDILKKHAVAVVEKFTSNIVQQKRLIIVLGMRILGIASEKLGNPQGLDTASMASTTNPGSGPSRNPAAAAAANNPAQPSPQPPRAPQTSTVERSAPIFPIEGLSPYQHKWTIKARVTQKSDIKHWSNAKGEGKLFSMTLMDETGEIKATGFNQVVDDLFDRVEEGKVYFISRARVNMAKKKFSHLSNQYELSLERATEIEECLDHTDVPVIKYNFVELKDLETVAKDSICDVIGVVKDAHELGEIISKSTQKTIPKRELTLVDRSGFSVRLTLWGEQAKKYTTTDQPIIALKGVKVGDFGGRSLSMFSSTTMAINPDITEAHALRGWFDSSGSEAHFQSHSSALSGGAGLGAGINLTELRTTQEVKDMNLGQDKPDYFSTRIIVTLIKTENLSYPACPSDGCNKKVTEDVDGWKCEKCDRTYERPEYRYLVTFSAADHTGQLWLQGFNEVGLAIFGMSANDLKALEDQDKEAHENTVKKVISQTFNVACRAKQDTFNDTTRIRYGINRIAPLEFTADTQQILDKLNAFL